MSPSPRTLDSAGIAARIPHRGAMCLLHSLVQWSAQEIHCLATNQADLDHPLRHGGALLAPSAVEYAAQAMALHGALCASSGALASMAEAPTSGFLASARSVRLHVPRLDDVAGALHVRATQLAGDSGQAMYRFSVSDDAGRALVDGRATVVLDTPLQAKAVTP